MSTNPIARAREGIALISAAHPLVLVGSVAPVLVGASSSVGLVLVGSSSSVGLGLGSGSVSGSVSSPAPGI